MMTAGCVTVIWDFRWLHKAFEPLKRLRRRRVQQSEEAPVQEEPIPIPITEVSASASEANVELRRVASDQDAILPVSRVNSTTEESPAAERDNNIESHTTVISWKTGALIIIVFLTSFAIIIAVRGALHNAPRGYSLFANLYLAGTVIFGGGPVVIPLLREYIVAEGWVSARDFLLGLAVIQAFPGPNFNFAVYLGSLAVNKSSVPSVVGGIIGFLGIFTPGMISVAGIMGLWRILRKKRWAISFLRGVNAAAVGLIYTAVYRLWQTGVINASNSSGSALGGDPWWVAITATSFVGGMWFGFSTVFAIMLGGVMGIIWYGVVQP